MTVASKLTGCPTCGATISVDARFCGGCGSAISSTEPTQAGSLGGPDDGAKQIGREIAGRYRILAKLGEGGMGAVYRAEQISLKRKVALKLLKPELSADAALVRRFNAEAELAAKLNHPNTVTLYDFGQDSDGSLFIAMEFIEGRSLREVMVAEGPLETGRIVKICEQVCSSLADAHGRGIVHRDLKPDNVMLSVRGKKSDVVRVLDFGIAKLRDTQGDMTQMPMTRAGDLLGTPQYMAPEQIRGEKVDARTDIYAMGAMIYEMVTGRLPFEAPTLMAILSKHLTEMPVPPVERRADLSIPGELSALVMAMLAKKPDERPPTMDRVSDQLVAIAAEAPRTDVSVDAAGVARPQRVSNQMPSVVSAPPGVPRRLTTPGSQRPLTQPPVGPPHAHTPAPHPSHAQAPGHASHVPPPHVPPPHTPPPQAHGHASHAPPPHTPPPLQAQHQPPQIQPPVAPQPIVQRPSMPPPQVPETMRVRPSRGSAGLIWAIVAVVVIAGAGVGAFFALRSDDSGSSSSNSGASSGSSSTPTSGDGDVPSLADWDIKDRGAKGDGDGDDDDDDDDDAPTLSNANHSDSADFFDDRSIANTVWRHPVLPMHIHHPTGFQVDATATPLITFTGVVKGTPTQIGVLAMNTGAVQPEAAVRGIVFNIVSGFGGVVLAEADKTYAGATRYSGTYEVRGSVKGQFVVFQKGPLMAIVGVAVPPGRFNASKGFRDAFFDRAVSLDL